MNQLAAGCRELEFECGLGLEVEEEVEEGPKGEEERQGSEQTPPTDLSASRAAAATPVGVTSPLEKAAWYSATLRRRGEVSGSAGVVEGGEEEGEAGAAAEEVEVEAEAEVETAGKKGAAARALLAGPIPPSPTAPLPAQPSTAALAAAAGEPSRGGGGGGGHSGDQQGASGALAPRSARGIPDLRNCVALRQESQGCSAIQAARGMMGPARRGTLWGGAVMGERERERERRVLSETGGRVFFVRQSIDRRRN